MWKTEKCKKERDKTGNKARTDGRIKLYNSMATILINFKGYH